MGSYPSPVRVRDIFSTPVQNSPGVHLVSCTMSTGSLSRGHSMPLTTDPDLAPRLEKDRAIRLLAIFTGSSVVRGDLYLLLGPVTGLLGRAMSPAVIGRPLTAETCVR